MKLKGILMSLASLLGASIITIPMVENSRELAQTYRLSNEPNATHNQTNDLVGVDPTSIEIQGPDTLTGYYGIEGGSGAVYAGVIPPSEAYQDCSWDIENNNQGNDFFMWSNAWNSPASLNWSKNLELGTYNITIKATYLYDSRITATKDVTVEILIPNPTSVTIDYSGSNNKTARFGIGLQIGMFKSQAIVKPDTANQDVTWSLENNPAPDAITITQNPLSSSYDKIIKLSENNGLAIGTYTFSLKATTVDPNVFATKEITLNIVPNTPTSLSILGGTKTITTTSGAKKITNYVAIPTPSDASAECTWTFENNDGGDNIYFSYDERYNGQVIDMHITNTLAIGTYHYTLKATSVIDPTISATSDTILTIEPAPAPTAITIDGDTVLYGKALNEGSSAYTITTTPEDGVDQTVTWSLEDDPSSNPRPNEITIDQSGNLSWTNTLVAGNYSFYVVAVSNSNNSVRTSLLVRLVIQNITILMNGSATLNGIKGTSGSSTYTISTFPTDVNKDVTWSLENNTQGSDISINQSGELHWTNSLNAGTYNLTIKATSTVYTTIYTTKNITLTIAYDSIQLGDLSLAPGAGNPIINGDRINVTFGERTTLNATCSILNESNIDPNYQLLWGLNSKPDEQISITANGIITIPSTLTSTMINESLEIVCFVNSYVNPLATKEFTVYLTNSISPTSIQITGSDILNGTMGTAGSSSYSANVLPNNADPSVTWLLENNTQGDKISINQSGLLSWTSTLSIGTYNFTIKATSIIDTNISATKNVTLTIGIITPTSIQINGSAALNGTFGIVGSSSYTASVLPNNADQSVTWSLENNNQGSKISINQSGQLSWTNTLNAGTYNLTIKATSTALTTVSASKNVTLTISYEQPQLGEITFNGDVNDQFQFTWKSATQRIDSNISINNENNVDPNLRRSWSIENNPNNNAFEIDSTNGSIWINTSKVEPKIYNFNVVFSIGNMTKSKPLTINIVYAPIQDLTILGNDQLEGLANTYGQAVFSASVNPDNASNLVTWKLQNNPDAITIDAYGNLKWDNLLVGTYTFDLVATSTFDSNIFQTLTVTLTILPAPEKPSDILSDSVYAIIWGPALAILIIGLIVIAAYKIKQIKNLALE